MSRRKASEDDAQLDLSVEEADEPTAEHDAVADDAPVIDAAATEVLVDVAEADPDDEDADA